MEKIINFEGILIHDLSKSEGEASLELSLSKPGSHFIIDTMGRFLFAKEREGVWVFDAKTPEMLVRVLEHCSSFSDIYIAGWGTLGGLWSAFSWIGELERKIVALLAAGARVHVLFY